jgi:hypothetical protein
MGRTIRAQQEEFAELRTEVADASTYGDIALRAAVSGASR